MATKGVTTEQHLEKLRVKLSDEDFDLALNLASVKPDVVRYAFRLLGQVVLSKRDQETYAELVATLGEEAANTWRTARLAAKSTT